MSGSEGFAARRAAAASPAPSPASSPSSSSSSPSSVFLLFLRCSSRSVFSLCFPLFFFFSSHFPFFFLFLLLFCFHHFPFLLFSSSPLFSSPFLSYLLLLLSFLLLFFIFFVFFFSFFILPSSSPSPPSFTLYVFISFFFPSFHLHLRLLLGPSTIRDECCSNCSPNSLRLSTLASPIRIHNTYPHCRLYPHLTTYRKSSAVSIRIIYCIRTSVQLRLSTYPQYFFIHTLPGVCSIYGTLPALCTA